MRKSNTEYLKCKFSDVERSADEVTMGGVARPKAEKFRYLGSIIAKNGDIDE